MESVYEPGVLEAVRREVDHVEDDGEGGVERARQTVELLDAAFLTVVVHHQMEDVGERRQDDDEYEQEVHHVTEHLLYADGEVPDGRQELDEVEQRPRHQEARRDSTQLAQERDLRDREQPRGRTEHRHDDKLQLGDAIEVVVERRLATADDTLGTPAPPATVVQQEVGAFEGVEH